MVRGLFGSRKGARQPEEALDWPQLSGGAASFGQSRLDPPAVAYALSTVAPPSGAAATTLVAELLERVAAFRSTVADQLFEASQDYQILCNLTQENLASCEEIMEELRRRLAGNIHFTVLAKLDEIHALVAAQVAAAGGQETKR
jgi:hypothetical protein